MPGMPRISGKAKKIAYSILGKPSNMQQKLTSSESKVNKRLIYEETARVK